MVRVHLSPPFFAEAKNSLNAVGIISHFGSIFAFKPTIFEVILRQLRLRVPLYALHLLPCLTTKTILL